MNVTQANQLRVISKWKWEGENCKWSRENRQKTGFVCLSLVLENVMTPDPQSEIKDCFLYPMFDKSLAMAQ